MKNPYGTCIVFLLINVAVLIAPTSSIADELCPYLPEEGEDEDGWECLCPEEQVTDLDELERCDQGKTCEESGECGTRPCDFREYVSEPPFTETGEECKVDCSREFGCSFFDCDTEAEREAGVRVKKNRRLHTNGFIGYVLLPKDGPTGVFGRNIVKATGMQAEFKRKEDQTVFLHTNYVEGSDFRCTVTILPPGSDRGVNVQIVVLYNDIDTLLGVPRARGWRDVENFTGADGANKQRIFSVGVNDSDKVMATPYEVKSIINILGAIVQQGWTPTGWLWTPRKPRDHLYVRFGATKPGHKARSLTVTAADLDSGRTTQQWVDHIRKLLQ